VAAVGDLLFQEYLQRKALAPGQSYASFWQPLTPLLRAVDVLYGNLEGPAAHAVDITGKETSDPGRVYDGRVYGTVPGLAFNYHPSLLRDLAASGFAVVSTANNHALDRGSLGIDRTIDNLRAAGVAFTGTQKRAEPSARWSARTTRNGFTVAWLACTAWTNDRPDPYGQVRHCYRDRNEVLGEIAALAEDSGVDAIILTPHWGVENLDRPLAGDRAFARTAIEAGATAVIGTHPHVLQPWERWVASDGREGLIVYSTGNFISSQPEAMQKSGIVAVLDLLKTRAPRRAVVSAAFFIPTWIEIDEDAAAVRENTADTGVNAAALAQALRLLPDGNRISGQDLLKRTPRCADMVAGP
jgi:poly-gamma-glutamate synthesis protein (capsule biosynthesis protein)